VERKYLPLSDDWDDHAPGTLTWLRAWYAMQCDGDWEHGYGVRIETLDNPGWHVSVELSETSVEDRDLEVSETNRSEHDWLTVRREGTTFHAYCGPLNLGEALHAFRVWADGPPAIAD
jgi:hypothetical protein